MNAVNTDKPHLLTLQAGTAADLMTEQVVSIQETAPLREAVATLVDRGFSGAPVVNEAGRAVGVVSLSDIVVRDRNTVRYALPLPDYYLRSDLSARFGDGMATTQEAVPDDTLVGDIMTPTVFAVRPDSPAADVVREMVRLRVHRLFVTDRDGILVGVIAATDILRRLADGATV